MTLRESVDRALARQALIDAIEVHRSVAIEDLREAAQSLSTDDPAFFCLAQAWTDRYRLTARWVRKWAALFILTRDEKQPQTIAKGCAFATWSGLPHEDQVRTLLLSPHGEWADGEISPNPARETRKAFLERMERAYDVRVAQANGIDAPRKRELARHAEWFVRRCVAPIEEVADIVEGTDTDRSTVVKAVKAFSELVDIPLSEERSAAPSEARSDVQP